MRGTPAPGVPLFLCPICGWTHHRLGDAGGAGPRLGVPGCEGVLEQVAYAGNRTSRTAAGVGESDAGQPSGAAAATDTSGP